MPKIPGGSKGICGSCSLAESCSVPALGITLTNCENFVSSELSVSGGESNFSDTDPGEGRVLKGLCYDCEIRLVCDIPKSEGGIWHCEFYR